jgi:hypothetical protein
VARGRPNWWVILAVSLALMALLVATAGSTPHTIRRGRALVAAPADHAGRPVRANDSRAPTSPPALRESTTTTTTTSSPTSSTAGAGGSGTSLLSTHSRGTGANNAPAPVSVTTTTIGPTTTIAPATTTTIASPAVPADRTQTQGYLNPPLQISNGYGFTGNGAMEISVLWSGTTYLTMQVSCPNGSQSVGGTSAMAASLPNASGSCLATVSEPASESTSLTYTITIGPAGG